jgi:hypothetical protein
MVQLRPLTLVAIITVSGGIGTVVSAYTSARKYEQKIIRVTEEREGYLALADKALATSDRALAFASGYQEVLDTCMTRLYRSPTTVPLVAISNPKKGGIGGPLDVRKQGRLP